MDLGSSTFWIALLEIIGVNIVLSGDNAVVIALAARSLPPTQQRQAVVWGTGGAVVMRVVLTVVAVELMTLPWLKLAGALLLLWIALQLLLPGDGDEHAGPAGAGLMAAIRTILLADLVMSLDNVIAVAAAAKGSLVLLVTGLAVSIPLVIFASTLLLGLMQRYPIIVTVGAALIGWVAGEMAVAEEALRPWIGGHAALVEHGLPLVTMLGVIVAGKLLAARRRSVAGAAPAVDLAADDERPAAR